MNLSWIKTSKHGWSWINVETGGGDLNKTDVSNNQPRKDDEPMDTEGETGRWIKTSKHGWSWINVVTGGGDLNKTDVSNNQPRKDDEPMDTEGETGRKSSQELLEKIIGNELIAETISRYLTLGDMKATSEASRGFCQMIRSTKQFSEKAMILICKETVGLDYFIVDSTYPWKLAQIDISLPIEVLDIIQHILENAQTLQLRLTMTDTVEEKNLTKLIRTILKNSPKLKNLEIEWDIFERVHDVFSDVQVQGTLCRLKSFGIYNWRPFPYNFDFNSTMDSTYCIDGAEGDQGPFPRNFLQLSLIPGMQLETFKMPRICTLSDYETEHVTFISNIIAANSATLKKLSLQLDIWSLEDMKMIHCPVLKSLHITAYDRDSAIVTAFLTNQPLLEELIIDIRSGFPCSVLSTIQGKCSKLKKLHIRAKYIHLHGGTGDVRHETPIVDWSFLSGMEHLEDFSVCKPFDDFNGMAEYGTGVTFFSVLPAETIKKIELRGLDSFWFQQGEDGQEIEVPQRIAMINRFQNVTELKLIRSNNTINDETMQNIIREFRRLKVLEISHCDQLSDQGITGMNREGQETGVSLKDLKSLIHLTIRACSSISAGGIVRAVSLPYLKNFDYLTVLAVSKEFVLKIAEQNPSLECFSVFIDELEDIKQIKGEIKTVNRRLWKFTNLNEDDCVGGWSDSDRGLISDTTPSPGSWSNQSNSDDDD